MCPFSKKTCTWSSGVSLQQAMLLVQNSVRNLKTWENQLVICSIIYLRKLTLLCTGHLWRKWSIHYFKQAFENSTNHVACHYICNIVTLQVKRLRDSMSEERLNGLALLYNHRDINIPSDVIVNEFASSNKKMLF